MALSYHELCRLLKDAIPLGNPPDYKLEQNLQDENQILIQKVKSKYEFSANRWKESHNFPFSNIGCCEIGNFTGLEIQKVLYDMFQCKQGFTPGKVFYLSCGGKRFAAILRVIGRVVFVDDTPKYDKKEDIFSLLFNEAKIAEDQKDRAKQIQSEGKKKYKEFLSKKFADFKEITFSYQFLGISADVAIHSCDQIPMLKVNDNVAYIPYAACIILAFKAKISGKVTGLFGKKVENPDRDEILKLKAAHAVKTSEAIILQSIPQNSDEKWEESTVNQIVVELKDACNL